MTVSRESGELVIHDTKSPPYQSPAAFAYFVRPPTALPTPQNIQSLCRFGQCCGQTLELVFQVMSSLYVPSTIQTKKWPEVIKKEFTRSVHRFMASLTEGVNQGLYYCSLGFPYLKKYRSNTHPTQITTVHSQGQDYSVRSKGADWSSARRHQRQGPAAVARIHSNPLDAPNQRGRQQPGQCAQHGDCRAA